MDLGKSMHEDPQVPNYGKRGSGPKLKEGLVLAIEPMINLGKREVYTEDDGWTVRTKDGKPSVHFEHDVCVRKDKADILSDYSIIEKAEQSNTNLFTDRTLSLREILKNLYQVFNVHNSHGIRISSDKASQFL